MYFHDDNCFSYFNYTTFLKQIQPFLNRDNSSHSSRSGLSYPHICKNLIWVSTLLHKSGGEKLRFASNQQVTSKYPNVDVSTFVRLTKIDVQVTASKITKRRNEQTAHSVFLSPYFRQGISAFFSSDFRHRLSAFLSSDLQLGLSAWSKEE